MVRIFAEATGETFNSHLKFLKKVKKKGAKEVESHDKSDHIIIFCPIVSRFETDISTALSSTSEKGYKKVILVAMHHTFNEKYILPNPHTYRHDAIELQVDCLFHERSGFLKCKQNKKAVKEVCNQLRLSGNKLPFFKQRAKKKKKE